MQILNSYQSSLLPAHAWNSPPAFGIVGTCLKLRCDAINNSHPPGIPRTHTEKDLRTSQRYMRNKLGVSSTSQRICDELKPRGHIHTNQKGHHRKISPVTHSALNYIRSGCDTYLTHLIAALRSVVMDARTPPASVVEDSGRNTQRGLCFYTRYFVVPCFPTSDCYKNYL